MISLKALSSVTVVIDAIGQLQKFEDPIGGYWRYFLRQHYGMPTRLLDWTANPPVAILFGVVPS